MIGVKMKIIQVNDNGKYSVVLTVGEYTVTFYPSDRISTGMLYNDLQHTPTITIQDNEKYTSSTRKEV